MDANDDICLRIADGRFNPRARDGRELQTLMM